MRYGIVAILAILSLSLAHAQNYSNETNASATAQCIAGDPLHTSGLYVIVFAVVAGLLCFIGALRVQGWQQYVLLGVGASILIATVFVGSRVLEVNEGTMQFGAPGSDHVHADFAIMIHNQLVDLSDDRYISYQDHLLSRYVHLHDLDYVVHSHAENVTWKYFFNTLNIPMNDTCIVVRNQSLCNATIIIDGQIVPTMNVPIQEGARALFHYGGGNASIFFEQAVGNRSCMHSGTCPERGLLAGCSS
jgi:hypothetical protein